MKIFIHMEHNGLWLHEAIFLFFQRKILLRDKILRFENIFYNKMIEYLYIMLNIFEISKKAKIYTKIIVQKCRLLKFIQVTSN